MNRDLSLSSGEQGSTGGWALGARAEARRLVAGGEKVPPVEVEKIAEALGIAVKEKRMDQTARIVMAAGTGSVIYVDPRRRHPFQRRFDIAHELGHAVLSGRVSPADEEWACNAFAAELLMPDTMVERAGKESGLHGLALAESLAKTFEVSLTVAARRLVELDWPYVVIFLSWRERDGSGTRVRKLRVDSVFKPSSRDCPFIPRHKPLPEVGLPFVAAKELTSDGRRRGAHASDWVDLSSVGFERRLWVDTVAHEDRVLAVIRLE